MLICCGCNAYVLHLLTCSHVLYFQELPDNTFQGPAITTYTMYSSRKQYALLHSMSPLTVPLAKKEEATNLQPKSFST